MQLTDYILWKFYENSVKSDRLFSLETMKFVFSFSQP